MVLLPVIVLVNISLKTSYYDGILPFILIILVGIFFKLVGLGHGKAYNIYLPYLVVILFAVVLAGEDVLLTGTIYNFVKSNIQSFADTASCLLCC